VLVAFLAMAAVGCRSDDAANRGPAQNEVAARNESAPAGVAPRELTSAKGRPRIVVLGDSLTAGFGLEPDQAYPTLLQERLDTAGLDYEVVNAGVSGDTSAGAVRRLEWSLDGDVRVLVVALGGNDGLRGLAVDALRRNLASIIERAKARGIRVVLAGMEAPPNLGPAYTMAFHQVFPDLARQYDTPLIPFLLEGVAGIESLNQRDGIHPNPEGARIVADNVWRVVRASLEEPGGRRTAGR
jgi:acyl-CoA thioesterase-1